MKICWDNLENIYITSNGNFRNKIKRITYIYKPACKKCGEDYLTSKRVPSDYCSNSCCQKDREIKDSTRHKLSKALKNRKFSDDTKLKISERRKGKCVGENNYGWKGGVNKFKIPIFNTYAPQLAPVEITRELVDVYGRSLLEVQCSKCSKWFVPKIGAVKSRVRSLVGKNCGEARFYCSQGCKDACGVYGVSTRNTSNTMVLKSDASSYDLNVWSQEVLRRATYTCEICGEPAKHAHHIQPKKTEPFFATDPVNGVAVCENCHYKYGHSVGCSTGKLANTKCNKEKENGLIK